MFKILKLLFISSLFISVSFAQYLTESSTYVSAIAQGKEQNKLVVMFVKGRYCPWCEKMKIETLRNSDVIDYLNENYIFVTVDKDNDFYPAKFKPYGVPTTYVIDPYKQKKLFSMKGYKSPSSFLDRLRR